MKTGSSLVAGITESYVAFDVSKSHVWLTLKLTGLLNKTLDEFSIQDEKNFAQRLRKVSKPTLIVANKIDVEGADKNFMRLRKHYPDMMVIPASVDYELCLRGAEQKGLVRYSHVSNSFESLGAGALNDCEKNALDFTTHDIMGEYVRSGVQFAINVAVFKLLKMNAVYSVSEKLSDKEGNILPDVILMKEGSGIADLAEEISEGLPPMPLYAKDARYNLRLPNDYQLRDRDVISFVGA